jgi:hypothetical protein
MKYGAGLGKKAFHINLYDLDQYSQHYCSTTLLFGYGFGRGGKKRSQEKLIRFMAVVRRTIVKSSERKKGEFS